MKKLFFLLILVVACYACSCGSKSADPQAALAVTTTALPGAAKGSTYSANLTALGGTSPYSWSIASGQLPTGLTLSSTGVITGTPSASGEFNFTVQVTDSSATPATAQAHASTTTR
jgi:hypothetical protein